MRVRACQRERKPPTREKRWGTWPPAGNERADPPTPSRAPDHKGDPPNPTKYNIQAQKINAGTNAARDSGKSPAPRKPRGKSPAPPPIDRRFSPVRPARHPKYNILEGTGGPARAVPTRDVPAILRIPKFLSLVLLHAQTPPVSPTRKYLCSRLIYFRMHDRVGMWPRQARPKTLRARTSSLREISGFVQRIGAERADTETRDRVVCGNETDGISGR